MKLVSWTLSSQHPHISQTFWKKNIYIPASGFTAEQNNNISFRMLVGRLYIANFSRLDSHCFPDQTWRVLSSVVDFFYYFFYFLYLLSDCCLLSIPFVRLISNQQANGGIFFFEFYYSVILIHWPYIKQCSFFSYLHIWLRVGRTTSTKNS